jgi:SpoVK/Ycf46/Vps4 family AAA+-type ATPase
MSGPFHEDQRTIREIEGALHNVAKTFASTYSDRPSRPWPYEIRPAPKFTTPAKNSSESTSAMIAVSLLAMAEAWATPLKSRASSGYPRFGNFPVSMELEQPTRNGDNLRRVVDRVCQELQNKWRRRSTHITKSTTFGDDDPFTLGWALDITTKGDFADKVSRIGPRTSTHAKATLRRRLIDAFDKKAKRLVERVSHTQTNARTLGEKLMSIGTPERVGDSSYILVRFARVLHQLREDNMLSRGQRTRLNQASQALFDRFETRLHDHLSFFEIPDSRFDPAELAFCLEGMLLIRTDVVDPTVVDRVMSVLDRAQKAQGFWRAETPMVYGERGKVMFPVSVEAANSVLTSFALFDGHWKLHDATGSKYIHLVKRYWRWLRTREAFVRVANAKLQGWHSEHVNDPNLIHLWETSQVAEFLVAFRDQLKRAIARTALVLADTSVKSPDKPPALLDQERKMVEDALRVYEKSKNNSRKKVRALRAYEKTKENISKPRQKNSWEALKRICEPVTCLGSHFEIYDCIGKDFFAGHLNGNPKNFSMLLSGPPGTGKTTVASSLAWALGYPLITVTVSDFLADGHVAIEARAKDLFNMLKVQPRCVVLFDEIDQFMLDRDSHYFHNQETVFQFLTPGMLTKLNDLRESKTVIFIMATNYAERIDPAIKRRGRIDAQYILLPPDSGRRKRMFHDLRGTMIASSRDEREILANSALLSFMDLKAAKDLAPKLAASYLAEIKKQRPAMIPSAYASRFLGGENELLGEDKVPLNEYRAMALLELEAWRQHDLKKRREVAKDVRNRFDRFFVEKRITTPPTWEKMWSADDNQNFGKSAKSWIKMLRSAPAIKVVT